MTSWILVLLPATAIGRLLCTDGIVASVQDSFVCCQNSCGGCNETKCLEKVQDCCPAVIYRQNRECAGPEDSTCTFSDGGWYEKFLGEAGTRAKSRQVLHSSVFCRRGVRGVSGDGLYEGCCSATCSRCRVDDHCVVGEECCVATESEKTLPCVDPDNVTCAVHRHELEVDGFKSARRDLEEGDGGMVHVVIAGDRVQALGIIASARSVFQSTRDPQRVFVHVVVDPASLLDISASLECTMRMDESAATSRRFRVYAFDIAKFSETQMRAPKSDLKGNLAAGPNFARFYLSEILPRDVQKVVYLDADTVLMKDVAFLYDTSLTDVGTNRDVAIAAVSRRYKPLCPSFLNCRSDEVRLLLRRHKIYDPDVQLNAFNAGILVIHLERWRELNMTGQVLFWIEWNNKLPLYKLGSNPPLVLSVRDKFQHLDSRWNCQRGHTCWDRGDAGALHWNGAHKPWNLVYRRDAVEWLPFLQGVLDDQRLSMCLKNMPQPGDAVPILQSEEEEKQAGATQGSKAPKSSPRSRSDYESMKRLMSPIFNAVKRFKDDSLEPTVWRKVENRVFAQIHRSLERWPRFPTPNEFVASFKRVAARLKDECDYAVVAILGGTLHVQSSASRCLEDGKMAESLNFLDSMLRSELLSVADVVFVLCVSASNTFEEIPVFMHSKIHGHDQPGILLPGPMHTTFNSEKNKRRAEDSVQGWERRYEDLRKSTARTFSTKRSETRWGSRFARAVWRGRNPRFTDCSEDWTWARLEAVSLSLANPTLFDTRFTRKLDFYDTNVCIGRASESPKEYQRYLKRLFHKYVPGTARHVANPMELLSKYRYVMELPEKEGRSDPILASLWALASVVILWDAPCVDWYEPATRNGETHIVVNADTASIAVTLLTESEQFSQHLARRALELHENILSPRFVSRYMAKAFNVYRMHFGFNSRDKERRGWLTELLKQSGLEFKRYAVVVDDAGSAPGGSQHRVEEEGRHHSNTNSRSIFGFLN